MKPQRWLRPCRHLPALLLSLTALSLSAQTSQTVIVRPAASAPAPAPASKPQPRLLTLDEKRASATAPGTLQPERPALPQVAVPLERTAGAKVRTVVRTPRREAAALASSGRVSEGAALCGAQKNPAVREDCRDDLHARRAGG
ncbi:hypothetical protein HLB44_02360 [Aquincola sp. S2]|uniref:Uncharacterized protein n=1 Tax=Pseudaquabacterium terrae TaxID=2732868 RepID=A0ABX2ED40_9BURK|nr:hypothetical protein [Aquabacterium terrae]NRF65822.1 hypothetical protein [Aquabacterium terrae]